MRLLFALLLGSVLGVSAWRIARCGDEAVRGKYVEARTASVFAGACHYNGELVTAGREAMLAWHIDSGRVDGTSLAGLDIVAVVHADENLKDAGQRSSVVYLPEGIDADTRAAALAAIERHAKGALGEIRAVKSGAISVAIDDERYDVKVCGAAALSGTLMADRACCKMPQQVWYEPMTAVDGRVVGNSESFAFEDPVLGPTWKRSGENDAFVGSFAWTACCETTRGARRGCCVEPEPEPAAPVTP